MNTLKNIFTWKNVGIATAFTVFGGVLAWKWNFFDRATTKIAAVTPGFQPQVTGS